MKKWILTLMILPAALLALAACSPSVEQPAAETVLSQPAALIAEGRLLPVNWMDQSFSIPGQVAEVLVQDGDSVKAGQALARLNGSPEANAALARAQQESLAAWQALDGLERSAETNLAQAKLTIIEAEKNLEEAQEQYDADETDENQALVEAAEAELNQAEDLLDRLGAGEGVDPDLREAAEARLASASAALDSAQAALDGLELKASMDGVLVDMTLQAGQRVSAGQAVMTLADYSSWVVKTDNLTELEVVGLQPGQAVEVVLDALPEDVFAGVVENINTRFEEKRGDITYTVTVRLSQADPRMRWGMTAAVRFAP